MNLIDPEILNFYTQSEEDSRLTIGLGPLEFARNKNIIARYLPDHNAVIADVGGGTWHYAAWLSSLGHTVVLVDPVDKHVQLARKRSKLLKRSFETVLAEARSLPLESQSTDIVILHGPLYHLLEEQERIAALKEASRIMKPDGILLAFAITRAASTLAALHNGLIHQHEVFTMCCQTLVTGEHYAPENLKGMLGPAFFHRPSQLMDEVRKSGLIPQSVIAIEGMAWLDGKFFDSWASPVKSTRLADLVERTETDPDLLSISPHIMVVSRLN